MSSFAIKNPYFIIVVCLIIAVVGVTAVVGLPVDMFPNINIPVVVVATFFNGMPPEQIETSITSRFERFFTLASNIDHIESRSLPGVSLIKIYFQPGTNADTAVSNISNLAFSQLRRLPQGTLPPVTLKLDASSLPVCLVTVKGEGMSESQLRDAAGVQLRNQLASVSGASVVQPFGGRYRQIQLFVDPLKLETYQLSPMDVVRVVNDSNLILPAGDVRIGPIDYNIYTNSLLPSAEAIGRVPIRTVGGANVTVSDVAQAKDSEQLQYNLVRVDGQPSVYVPVLKQGGDSNTIAIVDGVRKVISNLLDVPKELVTRVVFDQSLYVKRAIETLMHEGGIGLFLTSLMILVFLGSMRATVAVFISIPLSALATFIFLWLGGSSINTMVLSGLALAFSRLIDNSVVVLENIFRHLEMGESPLVAAELGGREVALPVLAATLTTVVVFFPVTFLYGVSKFLFSALALAVVLSLFASYMVALTVVPLFCARFIKGHAAGERQHGNAFVRWFNARFEGALRVYDRMIAVALKAPAWVLAATAILFIASLGLYPFIGLAFFPRTDAGQFIINLKAPAGTRLEYTEKLVKRVEEIIRTTVAPHDLSIIVSNIGATPDTSAIYTTNSAQHTAFVQVSLVEDHKVGSYEYMDRVRRALDAELPQLSTYFTSGGLVDAVLNLGLPAPIDIQVSGSNIKSDYATAQKIAAQVRALGSVKDVFIPQDIDSPGLQLDIDRTRASELGLQQREIVSNVITSLTSNQMIAPSYWVDPKNGIDYLMTVQYPENQIKSLSDLRSIPIRAAGQTQATRLDAVASIHRITSPTEIDHYQIRREIDIYVSPSTEDLGRVANSIDAIIAATKLPDGVRVDLRGMVQGMRASFRSFGIGLSLAVVLLFLILVAQFRSFRDPFLILLAVPPGIAGVMLTLALLRTTLNVQSLLGVIMMVGIVVSNSILIVEFTHRLREDGMDVKQAVAQACRIRMRPVLMTSLATVFGLLPMALKIGTGSEAFAPLAQAIIGGLTLSLIATIFVVPAAYLMTYREKAIA